MTNYHCIIHLFVFCASMRDKFYEIMEIIMKIVNFLRSTSALQHRLLRSFLVKIVESYDDLLLHNNVEGEVKDEFCRGFGPLRRSYTFLKGQNSAKAKLFLDFSGDDVKMETTGFSAAIMLHLNDLNVELQGKNH